MTGYKVTDNAMRTQNGCVSKLGEYKTASGVGELCSSGWLHFYRHPLLAVLHNPIHAGYDPMRLFESDVVGRVGAGVGSGVGGGSGGGSGGGVGGGGG